MAIITIPAQEDINDFRSSQLPQFKRERLENQQYRLVGNHSAVKICYWCKKSIKGTADCYKNDFYGIPTHQCLEMSPAITCNKRCRHCWRDTSVFSKGWTGPVDDPKFIVEECIKQRYKLLTGLLGNKTSDPKKVKEADIPKHAAVSLTGEPMMYPRYPELINEFFRHGFTTVFAVTSGTAPETIKKLEVHPTNIYLSVEAWNEELYKKLCIPVIPDAWEKFLESAEILKTVPTRTIMRITCMKELNMHAPKFAWLVDKMKPDVVECKAYAWMGHSKQRMQRENSPNYDEVDRFARKLMNACRYDLALSKKGSDIVMLRRPSPRIINGKEFFYDGLENEKTRTEEHLREVSAKLY